MVRQVFVRGGEQFAMNKVQPGSYEIRYLKLDTSELLRTQRFDVRVKKTADGEEYLGWTVGLYGTPGVPNIMSRSVSRSFPGDEGRRGEAAGDCSGGTSGLSGDTRLDVAREGPEPGADTTSRAGNPAG